MKHLLTVLFLMSLIFAQNGQNFIYWSESSKLEWKDFKGQPNLQDPNSSGTEVGTSVQSGQFIRDTLSITILAVSNPMKSWVKKGSESPTLLAHERLHFDIQELCVRKLRKSMTEFQFKKQTMQADFQNFTAESRKEVFQYQSLYDNETNHSKIVDKQKEWETKIAAELNSLAKFKNPVIKVAIK